MKRKNLSQLPAHLLEMIRVRFENLLPFLSRSTPLDQAAVINHTHDRDTLICADRLDVNKVEKYPPDVSWG